MFFSDEDFAKKIGIKTSVVRMIKREMRELNLIGNRQQLRAKDIETFELIKSTKDNINTTWEIAISKVLNEKGDENLPSNEIMKIRIQGVLDALDKLESEWINISDNDSDDMMDKYPSEILPLGDIEEGLKKWKNAI